MHATKGLISKARQVRRDLTAHAQDVALEATSSVKRVHREWVVFDGQEHELAPGVWYSNRKQRRGRLDQEQVEALRELGVTWAAGA